MSRTELDQRLRQLEELAQRADALMARIDATTQRIDEYLRSNFDLGAMLQKKMVLKAEAEKLRGEIERSAGRLLNKHPQTTTP